ncbi:hypothetical protein [Amycolatopsis sp. YIM 10]|uniref:hypothetical protein n=1 Tax=Amycolatopsis sp. YIM 10 TaxID=2653857 RepID=UPI00129016B1|nr:hypothetical protein [Amycolatopsis sp. YIM 10]
MISNGFPAAGPSSTTAVLDSAVPSWESTVRANTVSSVAGASGRCGYPVIA